MAGSNDISLLTKEFISTNTEKMVNVVEFAEAPWGLNLKLFPVQRFILKCLYGLPLDKETVNIRVPDIVNEHVLYELTEHDFLQWLYAEKRCNVNLTEGKTFLELLIVAGRRGSKSTLAAIISNFEIYKLLKRMDPAKFYGFPPGQEIDIINVATADDQADTVYGMTQNLARHCLYIKDRILHDTANYFDVQSDADKALGGKAMANINVLLGSSSSNAVRSKNAIIVIMDEFAFFIDNGGRFSGSEVYKALTPSVASFGLDGKVLVVSSPYAKYGRFWERYNESFNEPDSTLMFKMYTSMMNPTIRPEILKAARRRNRSLFMGEYGGEFTDSIMAWIEDESEFRKCIVGRPMPTKGIPDVEYYMGIDLGFKNDGTAICIVHDDGKRIVLDYADVWYSGSSDVWEQDNSIYGGCREFAAHELIKMDAIVRKVQELDRWFPLKKGIFDQHNGYGLAELLSKSGMKQVEMEHFTDFKNSEVYELMRGLYAEGLVEIPDHSVLVPEMLTLEAERKSKEKTIVRAPNRPGAHDDISDAYVRACWLCFQNRHGKPINVSMGTGSFMSSSGRDAQRETSASFALKRFKQHGEHPRVGGIGRFRRLSGSPY